MGRIAWGRRWLKGPRHWLTEDDAALMIQYAAGVHEGDVDQRLCVFAAAQCAKTALDVIEPASLRREADVAMAAVDAWVRGEKTAVSVQAASAKLNDVNIRQHTSWSVRYAVEAVIFVASATWPSYESSEARDRRVAGQLRAAVSNAAMAIARGPSFHRRQAELADLIRIVIPYPRAGELVAMAPGFYVVFPRVQRDDAGTIIDESVLGLQQAPQKVRGRWWDGYLEGPAAEIIDSIPNPTTMREVYERLRRPA